MAESQLLCRFSDLIEAQPQQFDVAGTPIVVVRIGEQVYALEDRCSHEDFPLSDGLVEVDECQIECSRHGAMFSLETGAAFSLPAIKSVATIGVRVIDGHVEVTLP